MSEKEPRDYWSDCKQVFFTGGKGFGVTERLRNICLGKEEGINKFFETGELSDVLNPTQRQVLLQIQQYREEQGIGQSNDRLGKRGVERSRSNGSIRSNENATGQYKAKQRLPVRPTRATVKSISGP